MIAGAPRFIRRLRTKVRARVRGNPALRREWKLRRSSFWRRSRDIGTLRFLVPGVVAIVSGATPVPERVAGVLIAWSVLGLFLRITQAVTLFSNPQALWPYYQLPVGEDEVFTHQLQILRRAARWTGVDWLAYGLGVAGHAGVIVLIPAAVLLGYAQWFVTLAATLTLARWRPVLSYGSIAIFCSVVLFLAIRLVAPEEILRIYMQAIVGVLKWIAPAGWGGAAFLDVAAGGWVGWIVLAALAVAGTYASRRLVEHWRMSFSLTRMFGEAVPAGEAPADDPEPSAAGMAAREKAEAGSGGTPAEWRSQVDRADLRAQLEEALTRPAGMTLFQRGLFERQLTRMLTERQRLVLDYLAPFGFSITRGWRIALAFVMVAYVALWLGVPAQIAVLALIVAGFFGLPTFSASWLGFNATADRIGAYCFVPIGFGEAAWLMIKIALLRCLAAVPLILLATRYAIDRTPVPWPQAFEMTGSVLVLLVAAQPFWIIGSFSKHTNDSASRWWLSGLMLGFIFLAMLPAVIALFACAAMNNRTGEAIAGAVLLVSMYGALAAYGWVYNRGLFDLIAPPPKQ